MTLGSRSEEVSAQFRKFPDDLLEWPKGDSCFLFTTTAWLVPLLRSSHSGITHAALHDPELHVLLEHEALALLKSEQQYELPHSCWVSDRGSRTY